MSGCGTRDKKVSVPEKLLSGKSSHLAGGMKFTFSAYTTDIARVEAPCRAVPRNFRVSFVFDAARHKNLQVNERDLNVYLFEPLVYRLPVRAK